MPAKRQKHHVQHDEEQAKIHALIKRYQERPDDELQTQLINYYKGLVTALAARFSRGSELHEDLVQVGMIGLLAALRRFEEKHGPHFEGFAVPTIVGEMKRYLRDKTWSVHVPRRIKELGPQIKKAIEALTIQYQRSPQIKEIASHLRITEEEVLETMEMTRSYHALSVDMPIETESDGDAVTLLGLIGEQEDGYERVDRKLVLRQAFDVLTERESRIIHMRFFDNLSQQQVGEALGISQMHVSRLQRRALLKLKQAIHLEASECM